MPHKHTIANFYTMGRVKLTNDYYSENFDSFQQQTNKTMDMNEEK